MNKKTNILSTLDKSQLILIIEKQQKEKEVLIQGIQKFVDKNFHGGAKSNREDYGSMVMSKEIYDLRELIKDKAE